MKTLFTLTKRRSWWVLPGILCALAFCSPTAKAQTPQYSFGNGTTAGNSIPFGGGTWADQRNQWFYAPGDFGSSVPSGMGITKIYVQSSGTYGATTWSNLKISLGQPNITNLTTSWVTGLTQVLSTTSYSVGATVAGDWIEFDLQQPFRYNPNLPLVVETIQTGTTGGKALRAGGTPIDPTYSGNTQTYGASSAATGTSRRYSYALGFDLKSLAPNDLSIGKVVSPTSSCALSNQENIVLEVSNSGTTNIPSGDTVIVSYSINNGTVQTDTIFLASDFDTLTSFNHTFTIDEDFSSPGNYNVKAWVFYRPDTVAVNDTLNVTISNPTQTVFPHFEDFDGSAANNNFNWHNVSGDDFNWSLNTGTTGSANTGPSGDHTTGSGTYLYTEASPTSSGDEAYYESPCIHSASNQFLFLEFWYHMYGTEIQSLVVEADDGTGWQPIFALNGQQQNDETDPYKRAQIDLSGFGSDFKVRFVGTTLGCCGGDIAIDDIRIFDTCANVAGIKPTINFIIPDTVLINAPTVFFNAFPTNQLSRHQWFLNGKMVSTSFDLKTTFSSLGKDTVKLVTTGCFGKDSITKVFDVLNPAHPPKAAFIADKNVIDAFEDVQLTDLSTYGTSAWKWIIIPDSIGGIPLFAWTKGNENSQNPVVNFYEPGRYSVCLIAINAVGRDTVCMQNYIEVRTSQNMCLFPFKTTLGAGALYDDGGPNADYSNGHNGINLCTYLIQPCAGSVILDINQFSLESRLDFLRVYDGSDNNGTPLWNTSANTRGMTGGINNNSVVTHLVASTGKMFIEFETDGSTTDAGFAAVWSSTPGNFPKPVADFDFPDTVCVGLAVDFESTSKGNGLSYLWDISNNNTIESTQPNFAWTFNSAGKVDVKLTVENCGGTNSIVKQVTVVTPSKAPRAAFYANILRPSVGETVNLYDTSGFCRDPNRYEWMISPNTFKYINGTDSSSTNPQVQFTAQGSYDVQLKAGNSAGVGVCTEAELHHSAGILHTDCKQYQC